MKLYLEHFSRHLQGQPYVSTLIIELGLGTLHITYAQMFESPTLAYEELNFGF